MDNIKTALFKNIIPIIFFLSALLSCSGKYKTEVLGSRFITQDTVVSKQDNEKSLSPDRHTKIYSGTYHCLGDGSDMMIFENESGSYDIVISLFRLTSLDCVGETTDKGLRFVTTDAAGNPMKGIIIVDGQKAELKFTVSDWTYIPSGTVYEFEKD